MNLCAMEGAQQGTCAPIEVDPGFYDIQDPLQEQSGNTNANAAPDWVNVLRMQVRADIRMELQSFAQQWLAPLHARGNGNGNGSGIVYEDEPRLSYDPDPHDKGSIITGACGALVRGCMQGDEVEDRPRIRSNFPKPRDPSSDFFSEKGVKIGSQEINLAERQFNEIQGPFKQRDPFFYERRQQVDSTPRKKVQNKQQLPEESSNANPSANAGADPNPNAGADPNAVHDSHFLSMAKGWRKTGRTRTLSNLLSGEHRNEIQKERTEWQKFVEDARFTCTMGGLIFFNSIMFGVQAQHQAIHRFEDPPVVFKVIEVLFCVIFVLELGLRIFVYGKHFFVGHEKGWNFFDVTLITMSVIDLIHEAASHTTGGVNMTAFRILRVLRLLKLIRMIRVLRFFRELRLMLFSIMNSVKSLVWAFSLVCMLIYVLGVFLTQVVTDFVRENPDYQESELTEYYGSLSLSLFSLYQAISGGNDWGGLADPLIKEVHEGFSVFYAVYTAFWMLAMVNVITGVFVESAIASAAKDTDVVIQEEMEKRNSYLNEVKQVFLEADTDCSGQITWQEFHDMTSDPRVAAYLQSLELDTSEVSGLFKLLDTNDTGFVSTEEFLMGCLRLKGSAKEVDVATLLYETKRFSYVWREFTEYFEKSFEKLDQKLGVVFEPPPPDMADADGMNTNAYDTNEFPSIRVESSAAASV